MAVGVTLGWGLVTGLSDLDCFSLVKTMASATIIASRITVTTTTAIMRGRLLGLQVKKKVNEKSVLELNQEKKYIVHTYMYSEKKINRQLYFKMSFCSPFLF